LHEQTVLPDYLSDEHYRDDVRHERRSELSAPGGHQLCAGNLSYLLATQRLQLPAGHQHGDMPCAGFRLKAIGWLSFHGDRFAKDADL